MNVICLIQLIAVFLITAVMVSTLCIRYRTYNPVKSILERDGLYCMYTGTFGAVKPGGSYLEVADAINSAEELRGYMKADNVITIQTGYVQMSNGRDFARPLFYDNEMIKRYSPQLKKGMWISPNSDELEIVIPEGMFDADVGDNVELLLESRDYLNSPFTTGNARIVGILEDGAEILGKERSREISGDTYRFIYEPYYPEMEKDDHNPIFLASADALGRLCPDAYMFVDSAFLIYNDPTDEDMVQAHRCAAQMGSSITISLNDMNNSKIYLREQILQLLPIVIVLMILVIVTSVSVSALVARQRLKDYTKYYILGLQWKQCALVNLLQALIVGAASLIIAIILIFAVSITAMAETIMIIWNFWLLTAFFGILALYLIFSMLMPLIMLGSTTPKAQLQAE